MRRALRDEGAVAVVVAVACTVIFSLAAIVIDLGLARDQRRQAQNTADSAALAAAEILSRGGEEAVAAAAARRFADVNMGVTAAEWASCTDPGAYAVLPGGGSCISYDAEKQTVRVLVPSRTTPVLFAGFVGSTGAVVGAEAEAGFVAGAVADCGLCILTKLDGQVGSTVVNGGNVLAGEIDFNNDNGGIDVTGGTVRYSGTWNGEGEFNPAPPVKVAAFVDPYAELPLPPVGYPGAAVKAAGPNCDPGNYTDVEDCKIFRPGVYVIVGETTLHSQDDVIADDVLFYFTCATAGIPRPCGQGTGAPEAGGSIGGNGKGQLTLTGLSSGSYKDFAIIVDRNNSALQKWAGQGLLTLNGILYAPFGTAADDTSGFSERGNGDLTVNGRAVLGRIELKGQGNDKLHLRVNAQPVGPPVTPHSGRVKLVR